MLAWGGFLYGKNPIVLICAVVFTFKMLIYVWRMIRAKRNKPSKVQ